MGRTTATSALLNTFRHRSEPSARAAAIEAPPAEVRLTAARTPARRVE